MTNGSVADRGDAVHRTLTLKKQLKMKLDDAVLKSPMGKKVWENYPYRTKIPELCLA